MINIFHISDDNIYNGSVNGTNCLENTRGIFPARVVTGFQSFNERYSIKMNTLDANNTTVTPD